MPSKTWEYENKAGDEVAVEIPMKWEICGVCDGNGSESAYLGAITQEDRDRDWSFDEWEDYMTGGYDRPCAACRSTGKVQEVDWELFERQDPEACDAYEYHLQDLADDEATYRMEMMLGC